MIGFYNYTVILTYMGVVLSICGMIQSFQGRYGLAVLCLGLAGVCDAFDGTVARTKKNRTREEEIFGVQIDSLCDVICFGVTPAILAYNMGMKTPFGIVVEIVFVLCGVIRLAYFNMMEELRHTEPPREEKKYYHGLPITSSAIIIPMLYLFHPYIAKPFFLTLLSFTMLGTAFLYVVDIRIPKLTPQQIGVIIVFMAVVMMKILHIF